MKRWLPPNPQQGNPLGDILKSPKTVPPHKSSSTIKQVPSCSPNQGSAGKAIGPKIEYGSMRENFNDTSCVNQTRYAVSPLVIRYE